MSGTAGRLNAILMRHYYLLRGDPTRLIAVLFWPAFEIVLWGFMSLYMNKLSGPAAPVAQFILGGAVLWTILARGEVEMMISFMEEFWSRNFGHLFVAPLRPWEFVLGVIMVATLRTAIGASIALLAAVLLFDSAILQTGLLLILQFLLVLLMSWSLGLMVMSMIFRFGMAAEWLSWMLLFALMPISCVYYPLSALPGWLQAVANLVPATPVFEGMRYILAHGTAEPRYFIHAGILGLLWLSASAIMLMRSLRYARANALFVQQGE